MFIVVVLSILFSLNLFWVFGACWLQRRSEHRRRWWFVTGIFVVAQIVGLGAMVAMRFGSAQSTSLWFKSAAAGVFIWHLLLLPVAVSVLWLGLGGWGVGRLASAFTRILRKQKGGGEAVASEGVPRREFLSASLAILPPLLSVASAGGAMVQLNHFRLRRLTLALSDLPPALDGMTLTHLSDLHVGPFTSGRILEDVLNTTNELGSDLIVFTGDLINTSLTDLPEALRFAKRLTARHGVYFIEGNHDLLDDGREFTRRVRDQGVNLLINEAAILQISGAPVQLLGLRWGSPAGKGTREEERGDGAISASMKELLRLRSPEAFPILLAHHPHAFDSAAAAGISLTLAGHTHGGQLMLSEHIGFGPAMFRYWSGLYSRGKNHLVVSNGVGNWFPVRSQAPAEIVHLTLKRA